jgi:molybdopterin-containing oxidoreductase family iron-sulfur binding subunit
VEASFSWSCLPLAQSKPSKGFELVLYQNRMGDGQQANNPWLQEFPDPITRVYLGIIITVSNADAKS